MHRTELNRTEQTGNSRRRQHFIHGTQNTCLTPKEQREAQLRRKPFIRTSSSYGQQAIDLADRSLSVCPYFRDLVALSLFFSFVVLMGFVLTDLTYEINL